MKKYPFLMILACTILVTHFACSPKELNNVFYAQNTLNGFSNAPITPQEKARLLKSIGFDGLEGFGYKDYFALKDALEREGLKMPVNYVALPFEADGMLNDSVASEIKEMIAASSKGEIMYCETVAHSVKLARMVSRENYGVSVNLCHLLRVEGSEGIKKTIKESVPYLFAVNICGADDGDTKQYGWDRLIQPLGKGTFDTYGFTKLLVDNGYSGPIGLQCYNLKGNVVEILKGSMKTWEGYKARYLSEK